MLGKTKGGRKTPTPGAPPPAGSIRGLTERFLSHLEARSFSRSTIDTHRWALRQFAAWYDTRGFTRPASLTRADLEAYQLHLFHYRSLRTGQPLAINTQLARLGCVRRFYSGVSPWF